MTDLRPTLTFHAFSPSCHGHRAGSFQLVHDPHDASPAPLGS